PNTPQTSSPNCATVTEWTSRWAAPESAGITPPAESFLATLKKELAHRRVFKTRAEARLAIRHWVEAWYNRRRLHSALGYQTPIEWEDHYRHTNTMAA
ncbi:MAG: integrase core domain-containing protein, partial [Acidimicrobiia bacterium]